METLTSEEYERRRNYNEYMKTMDKNSFIEVARILKKHSITVSENRSGLFFDLVTLPQAVFDDLVSFRSFVENNIKQLDRNRS
jgi:hypothetical protein